MMIRILIESGGQKGTARYEAKLEDHKEFKIVRRNPDYIVVLSGDGGMLRAQKKWHHLGVPFIGMGFGTRNFMLHRKHLTIPRLARMLRDDAFDKVKSHALSAELTTVSGKIMHCYGMQDVYMKGHRANVTIQMNIDGKHEIPKGGFDISGDGVIIANPMGSSGYNANAGGPIIGFKSGDWALSGIVTDAKVSRTIPQQRTVISLKRYYGSFVTDNKEYKKIVKAVITPSDITTTILMAKTEDFERRRWPQEMSR